MPTLIITPVPTGLSQAWHSVRDALPELLYDVLAVVWIDEIPIIMQCYRDVNSRWRITGESGHPVAVSHWMPEPELPEELQRCTDDPHITPRLPAIKSGRWINLPDCFLRIGNE